MERRRERSIRSVADRGLPRAAILINMLKNYMFSLSYCFCQINFYEAGFLVENLDYGLSHSFA